MLCGICASVSQCAFVPVDTGHAQCDVHQHRPLCTSTGQSAPALSIVLIRCGICTSVAQCAFAPVRNPFCIGSGQSALVQPILHWHKVCFCTIPTNPEEAVLPFHRNAHGLLCATIYNLALSAHCAALFVNACKSLALCWSAHPITLCKCSPIILG